MYPVTQTAVLDYILSAWRRLGRWYSFVAARADRHPGLWTCCKFVIVFVLFGVICWTRLDPDFGWHLQAGNFIRAHGIPAHDIFTYTARDFAWIDHEWGADVLVSYLYQWGGYVLLTAVFAGLWSLALFVSDRRAYLSALLFAVAVTFNYAGIRPVTWTVLFLAVLIKLLLDGSPWQQRFIPMLFLVWANLHGGFVIGLFMLGYFAVRRRSRLLTALLCLSVLATFINPYGPRLYEEIFRTLFDRSLHTQIAEWRTFYLPASALGFVCLWWSGFWLYRRRKLSSWLDVGPLLFASALSATRNLPLFAVVGLRYLGEDIGRFRRSLPRRLSEPQQLVLGALLAALLCWIGYTYGTWARSLQQRESGYPVQAVAYLQAHPCDGAIFNDYNYGGYLIWKLPGQAVYIDGRMPSWRDASGQKYLDRYHRVISSPSYQQQQFATYNVRCVVFVRNPVADNFLDRLTGAGWRPVVETPGYALLLAPAAG